MYSDFGDVIYQALSRWPGWVRKLPGLLAVAMLVVLGWRWLQADHADALELLLAAPVLLVGTLAARTYREVAVHEKGIILWRGWREVRIAFDEVAYITCNDYEGSRHVKVKKHAGRGVTLTQGFPWPTNVPAFESVASHLLAAYEAHVLERYHNNPLTEIQFGWELTLQNGNFTYRPGKKHEKIVPFDDVYFIEEDDKKGYIHLRGYPDDDGNCHALASLLRGQIAHLDVLRNVTGRNLS